MTSYESIIFIAREVLVYQIPPLRTSQGYRASEWDVDRPIWRGRLRVIETGHNGSTGSIRCELRLEDLNSGELFACAPYSTSGKGVEQVTDSSRFFAIRVVDGERHAYLGMGFMERSEAFDFNIALQDFKRHGTPAVTATRKEEREEELKDYSLKKGETITISLGKGSRRRKSPNVRSDGNGNSVGGSLPFLPPPPTAQQIKDQKRSQVAPEDDDFGDFVS